MIIRVKKRADDPVEVEKRFRVSVIDLSTEMEDKTDYSYYLTCYVLRRVSFFFFWTRLAWQEFDCFILDKKIPFEEHEKFFKTWQEVDDFMIDLELTDGDRPAGYGIEPIDY